MKHPIYLKSTDGIYNAKSEPSFAVRNVSHVSLKVVVHTYCEKPSDGGPSGSTEWRLRAVV